MAEKIDEAQVRKVAKLSRLDLTDSEIHEFTGQLESILAYVDKLDELDTEGVEPLAHCLPISNCLRADVVTHSAGADAILANAPQRDGDYFKVPKILDDNSGA